MSGRILLIANNFPPMLGGSASVYANLADCEPQRISVLAPSLNYLDGEPFAEAAELDRAARYRIHRLPLLRTLLDRHATGPLTRLLYRAEDVRVRMRILARVAWAVWFEGVRSICIGELLASAWMIPTFRRVLGVPVCVYIHGEEITTEDSYDAGHARARAALRAADMIVVVSRFTFDAVERLIGPGERHKISLIENGVNRSLFTRGPKSPRLLAAYGLEGKFVFVSVCRLLEKKGIDQSIRAFARLADEFPDSRYLVVGTGAFADSLKTLAAELGMEGRVIFTGRVAEEELVDHYRLGDVFVMPNRRMPDGDTEGFGLVFLEANSCGIPVIAGCDGGSVDAVTDGVNGLVVDGGAMGEVEAAMRRMRAEPALRARLAEGGLARVARAGWDEKARALVELMQGGAAEPAPSRAQGIAITLLSLAMILLASPYLLVLRGQMALRSRDIPASG